MLSIEHPGIVSRHQPHRDGTVTVWLLREDGSWAGVTALT